MIYEKVTIESILKIGLGFDSKNLKLHLPQYPSGHF